VRLDLEFAKELIWNDIRLLYPWNSGKKLLQNFSRRFIRRRSPFCIEPFTYPIQYACVVLFLSLLICVSNVPCKINQHDTPRCWIIPDVCGKRHMLFSMRGPHSQQLDCSRIACGCRWNWKLKLHLDSCGSGRAKPGLRFGPIWSTL